MGRRHGIGSIKWGDGSSYEGEWYEGVRHGNGVYRTKTGEEYRG